MVNRCCVAATSVTPGGRLAWGGMLACLLATGCTTSPPALPALTLTTSLDREAYRIGDPLIATVSLQNQSRVVVDVPRFDVETLKFLYGTVGLGVRMHREPVHSRAVAPERRKVKPGESIERRFVFTRVNEEAGEYVFLSTFRGAAVRGQLVLDSVYAEPMAFRVTDEVALRRDHANGLILKEQAVELAKASVSGEVTASQAVLMPLEPSGLCTWIVLLQVRRSDGIDRLTAVEVDPYVGKVRPLELKTAAGGEREP